MHDTQNSGALVNILRKGAPERMSAVGRVKFVYRPYICPFGDILALVPEGSDVLDVGCGAGQLICLLKALRNPASVTGLEISQTLVSQCKDMIKHNRFKNTSVARYDGRSVAPFLRGRNVVTMIDILHHIPFGSQLDYIKNLYYAMERGDRLILKDIDAASPLAVFNKLHDIILSAQIPKERRGRDVKSFCEDVGFRVLSYTERRTLVYPHYLIALEK